MDNILEKAILKVIIDKTTNDWDLEQPVTRKELIEILNKAIEIRNNDDTN